MSLPIDVLSTSFASLSSKKHVKTQFIFDQKNEEIEEKEIVKEYGTFYHGGTEKSFFKAEQP